MKLKKSICMGVVISAMAINSIVPIAYANESDEYETYTKSTPRAVSQIKEMPKEVINDLSELENMRYFKMKTDSNYEVALADESGEYTFVQEASTIEEAVNIADGLEYEYKQRNIIPTVIDSKGVIAYTTNSIGRIVKVGEGISESAMNYTVDLYEDSNKSKVHTYINHGYIDDVPVIEETDTMVKIEVAGFTGWIEKSDASGTNIVLLPINQATNLSYYESVNGELVHYISSNVQGNNGSKRTIGRAPSFMKAGNKYYSYDGNYFYNDINNLVSDAKADTHENSINAGNAYYNYYQYLTGRSKTVYSANDIDKYFEAKTPSGSALRGSGKYFIKAQDKHGVNASFMIGIAMNESGRGTSTLSKTKNNLFGIKANDSNPQDAMKFNSVEDCIDEFAKTWMSNGYLNPKDWRYSGGNVGNKDSGCNVRYASDPFWGEKASSFMDEMNVYLSSQGRGNDYNRYKLGLVNKTSDIKDKKGNSLYNVSKGQPVVISDDRNSNVEINPDRITPSNVANPIPGSYNWGMKGYINEGNIKIINQQSSKVIVDKIVGDDRYQTAAMIADNQSYTSAILVNADKTLVDGLSASGLSGASNSPILLAKKDSLPDETKDRLKGVTKVYIIGSSDVVSDSIENELKSNKIEVVRLGGIDRFETSYKVAQEIKKINPSTNKVFLVNGIKGEPDAMSVSSVASRDKSPIILTNGRDTPFSTKNMQSYVIGSSDVMNDNIAKNTNAIRLGGIDRFATNKLVVEKFYPNTNEFYVSKGDVLVDALTVSPLAKEYPVVLANVGSDKSVLKNATKIIQVGGMDKRIIDECVQIIK